jgi:hypothetical protein
MLTQSSGLPKAQRQEELMHTQTTQETEKRRDATAACVAAE